MLGVVILEKNVLFINGLYLEKFYFHFYSSTYKIKTIYMYTVIMTKRKATNYDLCSALMAIEQRATPNVTWGISLWWSSSRRNHFEFTEELSYFEGKLEIWADRFIKRVCRAQYDFNKTIKSKYDFSKSLTVNIEKKHLFNKTWILQSVRNWKCIIFFTKQLRHFKRSYSQCNVGQI